MSKTSLIMGLLISIGVHLIILWPGDSMEVVPHKKAKHTIQSAKKVALKLPAKPNTQEQNPTVPHPIKKELQAWDLENIVRPSTSNVANNRGDLSSQDEDNSLPPLRLVWDSPQQLIEVSRTLGMRILAVRREDIVGELSLGDNQEAQAFDGELIGFSNRVRIISPGFFGQGILQMFNEPIESFWVLVPSDLDREWISLQKKAIQSHDVRNGEVSYMEARIVLGRDGYKLVITKIVNA